MYSNVVLNVFNNPKNTGRISKPDGIADCYNADNTAHVEFSLRIENGIITNCQFRAQANPYIVAICSTITNMLKGKMIAMVFLDPYTVKKELGDESPIDISFCIDCVKMAIDDYKDKLEKASTQSKKSKQENQIETAEETDIKNEQTADNEELFDVNERNLDNEDIFSDDIDDDFLLDGLFDEED